MKILNQIKLKIDKQDKIVYFGIPDNEQEMKKMFELRRNVYKKNNYINSESDEDQYDATNKCIYFIAKIEEDTIGTVRLVMSNPLPTQDDFSFLEPPEMDTIPPEKRGELSRLISIPYKKKIYLPRHLVFIFLLNAVCQYCKENGVLGGYAFITSKLYAKMNKLGAPFHLIKKYKLAYPRDGLMGPYFYNENNPIYPIFFNIHEVDAAVTKHLSNKLMFTSLGNNKFIFKNNFYNKILKFLEII